MSKKTPNIRQAAGNEIVHAIFIVTKEIHGQVSHIRKAIPHVLKGLFEEGQIEGLILGPENDKAGLIFTDTTGRRDDGITVQA